MVRKEHNQVLFSKQILMFDWIRIVREEGKKSRMLPSFIAWVPGWREKRNWEWKADLVERFYFWFSKLLKIRITWDALKISFNCLIFTPNVNIMRAQIYWSECTMTSNSIFLWSFIQFMMFSWQVSWCGVRFPPPVDHVLSELFAMICPSWMALHSMAHSFVELHRPPCHNKAVIPEGGWQTKTVCWKTEALLCQQKSIWSRLWSSQWSCMVVRTGPWRWQNTKELMPLNCGAGEDSWKSLGQQGDQTNQA